MKLFDRTAGESVSGKRFGIKGEFLVFLLVLLAGRIIMYLAVGDNSVDPYITYRYAQNLAEGGGLVFNPGEKVQGFSSPLYTLLMAGFSFFLGSSAVPVTSVLVCILADILSLWILWRILSPLSELARFFACILFAVFPKTALIAIYGSEVPVVVLLMFLSLYFVQQKKRHAVFATLGLLLFCRIDGALWVVIVVGWILFERYRITVTDLVLLALPITIWSLFSALYFGSPLPHSMTAKSISSQHMFPAFDPIRIFLGYFPFRGLRGISPMLGAVVVCAFVFPVVFEFFRLVRRREFLAIAPAYFLFHGLAFSFGKVVMEDWYYYSGFAAYFLTLGIFINWSLHKWNGAMDIKPLTYKVLIAVILVGLFAIGARRWEEDPGGDFARYKDLGRWFHDNALPGSRLLIQSHGYVAWYGNAYVYDYTGLISPQVIAYRKKFPNSDVWFLAFVKDLQPTYVALRNWEIPTNSLFHGFGDGLFHSESERQWFFSAYRHVRDFKTSIPGDSVHIELWHIQSSRSPLIMNF